MGINNNRLKDILLFVFNREKDTKISICESSDCEFNLGENCVFKSIEIENGRCLQYRKSDKKVKRYQPA
jgi:hypothetical protein